MNWCKICAIFIKYTVTNRKYIIHVPHITYFPQNRTDGQRLITLDITIYELQRFTLNSSHTISYSNTGLLSNSRITIPDAFPGQTSSPGESPEFRSSYITSLYYAPLMKSMYTFTRKIIYKFCSINKTAILHTRNFVKRQHKHPQQKEAWPLPRQITHHSLSACTDY
jgi:hypothetical protein